MPDRSPSRQCVRDRRGEQAVNRRRRTSSTARLLGLPPGASEPARRRRWSTRYCMRFVYGSGARPALVPYWTTIAVIFTGTVFAV